jgi:DNA-binding SARP family transcriptional activator
MTSAAAHLQLLGGFRMISAGVTLPVPVTAAKLIALLAISDRPMVRSRVAGEFWPEFPEDRALANLRSTIWRLPVPARRFLDVTGTTVGLAGWVAVDLREARSAVRAWLDGDRAATPDPRLVELLSRPLLPEWDDDWLAFERERTRQFHIHALESLGHSLLDRGDPLSAVDVALTLVCAERLRESAHVLLMRAQLASGNRADAWQSFERYRALMGQEFDLDPAVEWEELVTAATPARPSALSGVGSRNAAMTQH